MLPCPSRSLVLATKFHIKVSLPDIPVLTTIFPPCRYQFSVLKISYSYLEEVSSGASQNEGVKSFICAIFDYALYSAPFILMLKKVITSVGTIASRQR